MNEYKRLSRILRGQHSIQTGKLALWWDDLKCIKYWWFAGRPLCVLSHFILKIILRIGMGAILNPFCRWENWRAKVLSNLFQNHTDTLQGWDSNLEIDFWTQAFIDCSLPSVTIAWRVSNYMKKISTCIESFFNVERACSLIFKTLGRTMRWWILCILDLFGCILYIQGFFCLFLIHTELFRLKTF